MTPNPPLAARPLAVVLACLGLLAAGAARAEPAKGGGDAAVLQTLRKAQGMLRQLAQEKADLEAKVTGLEAQVAERDKKIAVLEPFQAKAAQVEPLQNELTRMKAGLEAAQAGNVQLREQITDRNTRLQAAAEQYRKTGGELGRTRRDNQLLVNAVKERGEWIDRCTARNKSLLEANRTMLERLGGERSIWDDIKENEPFTGIGAIAKENTVQEFRFRLDDLAVTPWQEAQAANPLPAPAGEDQGGEEPAGQ